MNLEWKASPRKGSKRSPSRSACRRRGRARRSARGPRAGGRRRHRSPRCRDQGRRRGGNARSPGSGEPVRGTCRRARRVELLERGATRRRWRPECVAQSRKAHHARGLLALAVGDGARPVGSIELIRATRDFDPAEVAGTARRGPRGAHHASFGGENGAGASMASPEIALSLAGDALEAGLDSRARVTLSGRCTRSRRGGRAALGARGRRPARAPATTGSADAQSAAPALAGVVPGDAEPVRLEAVSDGPGRTVPATHGTAAARHLQLCFPPGVAPSQRELERLSTFAVRAAQALRAGERAREMSLELKHAQALLAVIGQAIAELSLAHTLKTAITRVSELLGADRVAVYLSSGIRLHAATGRHLSGAEQAVAERLLELAFGPHRVQGMLHVVDAQADLRLAPVREAVAEAGIDAALAVPLVAREELVGLLAAYLPRRAGADAERVVPRSRPLRASSASRRRTPSCTSARSASRPSGKRHSLRSEQRRSACALSTRSHVRSRRASPSTRRSTP